MYFTKSLKLLEVYYLDSRVKSFFVFKPMLDQWNCAALIIINVRQNVPPDYASEMSHCFIAPKNKTDHVCSKPPKISLSWLIYLSLLKAIFQGNYPKHRIPVVEYSIRK